MPVSFLDIKNLMRPNKEYGISIVPRGIDAAKRKFNEHKDPTARFSINLR